MIGIPQKVLESLVIDTIIDFYRPYLAPDDRRKLAQAVKAQILAKKRNNSLLPISEPKSNKIAHGLMDDAERFLGHRTIRGNIVCGIYVDRVKFGLINELDHLNCPCALDIL